GPGWMGSIAVNRNKGRAFRFGGCVTGVACGLSCARLCTEQKQQTLQEALRENLRAWALSADFLQLKSCRALNEAGTEQIQNKSEVTGLHLAGGLPDRGCCGC
uniref:Uncharacterized protein n=1 Tax=Falco tinnunculus TaxID=100819 RepID=A0A8C4XKJ1_FALTI